MVPPFDERPGEACGRRGDMRRHEGVGGQFIRPQGAPRVEAEPPEPEERRAEDREGEVMRPEGLLCVTAPLPQEKRQGQGRDPRTDMDDDPAGEIQRPEIAEPAPGSPDPVRQGIVDQGRPQDGEDEKGREFHPLREGADDQGRRDDGEHRLEDHEDLMRDRRRIVGVGLPADEVEPRPLQAADDPDPVSGPKASE